ADVDVLPSLLRQEAEALLRVIPLDLAAGHRDPPLNPAALDARTAPVRNTRDYPRRCRWPRHRQRPRRIGTLPVCPPTPPPPHKTSPARTRGCPVAMH